MRVAVVHDYLTQRGGAERVVLAMLQAFPGARLITSVYNPDTTFPEFRDHRVDTLPLRSRRILQRDHRLGLPLYGGAFRRAAVDDVDVVLCSSSGFAHLVGTPLPKVVYCHNTPRWLYQREEYVRGAVLQRAALRILGGRLMSDDRAGALTANRYLANSHAVACRVRAAYGIEPRVVHPPYGISPEGPERPVTGVPTRFLLLVARGRAYKNVAVATAAAERAGRHLVVVGGLPSDAVTSPWIVAVGGVDEAQLRWLYGRCNGVLALGSEDFGLTPLEGHAFGKPTLALRAGGYLDTVTEGVNGAFVDALDVDMVADALRHFDAGAFDEETIVLRAERFGPSRFADKLRAVVGEAASANRLADVAGR